MIERRDPLFVWWNERHKRQQSRRVINDLDNVDFLFRHTSNSHIKKLCCMSSRTTKQWSRWLSREEVRQWDNVSRTHRVALDWLFDRINLDPKIQINYIDTKTNSQTYWPRVISHVTNGIIFCFCFLTLGISVLQSVLKCCRKEPSKDQVKKESQQSQDQWWVWLQGLPQLCHLLHQKARENQTWQSSTSELMEWAAFKNGETCCLFRKSVSTRCVCRVIKLLRTECWCSQEWKSDEMMEVRTERPVVCSERAHQFVIEDDEAESELSLGSRSFLHRVNDQVRKRRKTILKRCNTRQQQTFCNMGNVYVFDIGSICIHGKEFLRNFTFHQEYRRSHNETDVQHIWEIVFWTIRWDLWSEHN